MLQRRGHLVAAAGVVTALALIWTVPARAQYFGRNRVRDDVTGFRVLATEHFDVSYESPAREGALQAARLPLWFVEGMAEYFSRGPLDAETALWLRDAVAHEALPSVAKLGDPKYFPYRWGHALWACIGGRWGDRVLATALVEAGRSGRADTALAGTLGTSVADLTRDWHAAVVAWAAALPPGWPPSVSGRLIAVSRGAFGLDAGPAVRRRRGAGERRPAVPASGPGWIFQLSLTPGFQEAS